ncbi:hypothetical protein ACFX1S_023421 [Malus domestica]
MQLRASPSLPQPSIVFQVPYDTSHVTALGSSKALLKFKTPTPRVYESPKPFLNPNLNAQKSVDSRTVRSPHIPLQFSGQELPKSRQLFDQMPHQNTISTNMMISSYVDSSNLSKADMHRWGTKPDYVVISSKLVQNS